MPKKRILTVSQAINEATIMAMKKDNSVYVIGEGVNDPKEILVQQEILRKFLPPKE